MSQVACCIISDDDDDNVGDDQPSTRMPRNENFRPLFAIISFVFTFVLY